MSISKRHSENKFPWANSMHSFVHILITETFPKCLYVCSTVLGSEKAKMKSNLIHLTPLQIGLESSVSAIGFKTNGSSSGLPGMKY